MSKDIKKLQKVKLDRPKLQAAIASMPSDDIKELLSVKDSQMFNLRRGERQPTVDGLLKLMKYHGLGLDDVVTSK